MIVVIHRQSKDIMCKERLHAIVVHEQVGLLLDIIIQCLVRLRLHVAHNWDLDRLELELLLAPAHSLDHFGATLMAAHTVCNVIQVHCRGEGARATILGTAFALLARVRGRIGSANLVTGLAVEEAVVARLAVDGCRAGEADRGISLEFETLHLN